MTNSFRVELPEEGAILGLLAARALDITREKGYGGALVRQRIVAAASNRQLILVEAEKLVPVLGSRGRLPVEAIPFALAFLMRRLEALGLRPELRTVEGRPFVSDNGNLILDCAVEPIEDTSVLGRRMRAIPGAVDTGLFLGTADTVLVAADGAVRELTRKAIPSARWYDRGVSGLRDV